MHRTDEHWVRPPRLRQGARVALVAPAGPVTDEKIELSLQRCLDLGLEPVLGRAVRNKLGYLAGTDDERAADLQAALDDPAIDAVWALRGGYGAMRLLPLLDWSRVREHPKPYIGFSDNTTLHLALFNAGVVSFHGPHPGGDFPDETRDAFQRVLFSDDVASPLPVRSQDPAPQTLRPGVVEGVLVGGNLSLLAAAAGTNVCLQARGGIVFIEDVAEASYRIDRALTQLDASGAFVGVAGFAFGRFTEVPECTNDRAVADVLCEIADRLRVPAIMDLPIGHIEHNWTIPMGVRAELDADAATLRFLETAVH
jgi:muramoyltetrapeptide carboxypeptidase